MPYPTLPQLVGGDIIQMVSRVYCKSQVGLNTYWYRKPALDPAQDLYTALDDWRDQLQPVITALMPAVANLNDVIMYVNTGGIWSEAYFSTYDGSVGTASGNLLPTQVAGIITRRVDLKGPRNRGRIYLPFPAESFLGSDEKPSDPYVAALSALAAVVLPLAASMTVAGGEWEPGLCTRNNAVATFRTLIDVRAHKAWATQRRRGDYGTPNVNT